ncbi:hypothetical protein D3C77_15460 [compost metagenome]
MQRPVRNKLRAGRQPVGIPSFFAGVLKPTMNIFHISRGHIYGAGLVVTGYSKASGGCVGECILEWASVSLGAESNAEVHLARIGE